MNEKKVNARFMMLFLGLFTAQIIYFGFWPSIMRDFGYSDTFIGFCTSLCTGCTILFSLTLGFVMDKYDCPRLLVLGLYGLYAVLLALVFVLDAPRWLMFLFYALAMSTVNLTTSFSNAWTLKLQSSYPTLSFSRVRSYGSIAYAVAGLFAGGILERWGNRASVAITLFSALLIYPSAFGLPRPATESGSRTEQVRFWPQFRELMKNRAFVLLSVCSALDALTSMTVTGYYSVVIKDLGGSSFQSGVGFFVMAFSEFWVVYYFGSLARKYTTRRLYAVGIVFTVLRSVALGLARTPWQAVGLIVLNAFSFALTMPGETLMANDVVDYKFKAAALQVMSVGKSLVRIIISPIQGMISDRWGVSAMLLIFSVFSAAELVLFLRFYKLFPEASGNS